MAGAQRSIEGAIGKLLAEPEPLRGASAKNDKDVSLVLHAHGLPTVRTCLLIAGALLLSASVLALAASADPFGVVAPYHSHRTASSRASKRLASRRKKSSAARRAKCATAARGRVHPKTHKACVAKKLKTSGGAQTPVNAGAPPAEALKAPGSEPGSSPESTGETTTPSEPAPPVEPTPPSEPTPTPEPEPTPPAEPAAPFRFFSPTGFWNAPLPIDSPLDPSSAAVTGAFNAEIAVAEEVKKGLPAINTTAWSVPIYTVLADQPTVKVLLNKPNASQNTLQAAWEAVPLPPEAKPANGTDRHLVVWQPSTDKLWEFWGLEKTEKGWQAKWGGAIEKVSSDPGAYGPEAWPGATRWWGASATSLSIAGGLVTLEDLEMGQINHALAMAIPTPRAGVYASPAERTDGWSTEPLSLPEGAHLRLDPNLDLVSLHLPRVTLMMAEAAQRYGIFIRDRAANVAFYAQDPTPTGTNPYTGATGYFEGKSPQQLLAAFPWSHLQLLKMELHTVS
jgi:hypothetical protein